MRLTSRQKPIVFESVVFTYFTGKKTNVVVSLCFNPRLLLKYMNVGINCRLEFFRFAELPQMWQFADLRFAHHIFFVICELRTKLFFADLRKYIIFSLTKISLKCSHSNLRTTFGFWDSFEI
jgi:hypothetical protein